VAGFDAFRLMAGAHGTLGVLLDVSLRVVPRPAVEAARVLDLPSGAALQQVADLGQEPPADEAGPTPTNRSRSTWLNDQLMFEGHLRPSR
jgi:FAD/FMN-containing dehydrogenase